MARLARAVAAGVTVIGLGACSLIPGDGPTTAAVVDGRGAASVPADTPEAEPVAVVPIDRSRARVVNAAFAPDGLESAAFMPDRPSPPILISIGDLIEVTIVSTSETGFLDFSQSAISPISRTTLPPQQVDARGRIHVPPAGRVRVAGLPEDAVERRLTARLGEILVDPTVIVRVTERAKARAAILGAVGGPGRYSLDPEATRLLDLIGDAGGPAGDPETLLLTLTRDGVSATLPLDVVLADPAYNIRIWPGDVVTVEPRLRRVVALGAFGSSGSTVRFDEDRFTLAQAVSEAGGMNTGQADRRGLFVFRPTPPAVLAEFGIDPDRLRPGEDALVPTVYQFDMREPGTVFALSDFEVRDGDLLYASDSFITEFNKVFSVFLQVQGNALSYIAIAQD